MHEFQILNKGYLRYKLCHHRLPFVVTGAVKVAKDGHTLERRVDLEQS